MVSLQRSITVLMISVSLIGGGCHYVTDLQTSDSSTKAPVAEAVQSSTLRPPDVVYVPTPNEVVERMLAIANVDANDVLYDLGSGDGRIPIMAVQERGVSRAVGIDIDPQRIQEANINAQQAGVTDRVQFLNQDLFDSDFSDATVVTLYLLPDLNIKLRPQLFSQLEPGTRVVSHDFDMGEWQPEQIEKVDINGQTHTVYLWRIPANLPANLRSLLID